MTDAPIAAKPRRGRPPAIAFEEALARLDAFAAAHGHANPKRSVTDPDGFRLGVWVANQRTRYRANRMPDGEAAALRERGVHLDPGAATADVVPLATQAQRRRGADRFAEHLTALDAFIARHGHAQVPLGHTTGGVALGAWLGTQRHQYRAGTLSDERIAALASRGIAWDPPTGRPSTYDATFADRLACLDVYRAEHGHANPGQLYACEHGQCTQQDLGQWLKRTRKKYRGLGYGGPLTAAQVSALEERGVQWNPPRGARPKRG